MDISLPGKTDGEPPKSDHLDVLHLGKNSAGQIHTQWEWEQWSLEGIPCYRDDDSVKDDRGTADQIRMSVREWVKRARIKDNLIHRDILCQKRELGRLSP